MNIRVRSALILAACALAASLVPARAGSVEASRATTLGRDPEVASLRAEVAAAPNDPCPLNELGVALARRSYYDEAVTAFRDSLEMRPDPIVWNNLGSVHLSRGRLGPAGSAFKRALDLDPNYALAHYNLGAVYDAQRDESNAVEHYKRALELDPKLDDPAVNPAILNNHYLLTVRTRRYLDTVGALGLPMQAQCNPAPAVSAAAPAREPEKGKGWWIFRRKGEKSPAPDLAPPEPPPAPAPEPIPAPAPEPIPAPEPGR